MIKEEKIPATKIERHKYCDICRVEIYIGLACSAASCSYCKKDLCEKCIGHEEETPGDYRDVYCKRCWELGEKYRPTIEEYHNKIDELYKLWQDECNNIQDNK